jgi:hypothetical protein
VVEQRPRIRVTFRLCPDDRLEHYRGPGRPGARQVSADDRESVAAQRQDIVVRDPFELTRPVEPADGR